MFHLKAVKYETVQCSANKKLSGQFKGSNCKDYHHYVEHLICPYNLSNKILQCSSM